MSDTNIGTIILKKDYERKFFIGHEKMFRPKIS